MSLLQMSFSGAILILIIIAARALTKNKLPKKTFIALWGIALLRLIIPISIPSVISAYSAIERSNSVMTAVQNTPAGNFIPVAPIYSESTNSDVPAAEAVNSFPIWNIIWLVGTIACLTYFVVSYIRCCREFRMSLPIENEFTKAWLNSHKLKRPIKIRQTECVSAPLTYGVFRPVILLPRSTDWSETDKLSYILEHEFLHIKRFDAIAKLIMIAAVCVHWFNPAVWVMFVLANRDIELSCDEAVLRHIGENKKTAYALTLIGMEEKKSGLTPLCSGFGKNAVRERITAIMKHKKTSLISALCGAVLIAGITLTFATSASAAQPIKSNTTKSVDAAYDYRRSLLKKLLLNGYENMTVSEFQNKIWTMTDTTEYMDLLKACSKDNSFKTESENDEIAAYYYDIIEPLTAEKWQTRNFSGYVKTEYDVPDNADLEYRYSLTITNAEKLNVGEYDKAHKGAAADMCKLFADMTDEELTSDQSDFLSLKADEIEKKWSSDNLKIEMNFVFRPLSDYNAEKTSEQIVDEERVYENGTEADYRSLLALKTQKYEKMSVDDFDFDLLNWSNDNEERLKKIQNDIALNSINVPLTDEELNFLRFTFKLSIEENAEAISSLHTGNPEEDPWCRGIELIKDGGELKWCSLWYQFSYHISDKKTLTVGERDRAIGGFIGAVQSFWDEKSLDELLGITENDIISYMKTAAEKYSTKLITIQIDKRQVQFQKMNETMY